MYLLTSSSQFNGVVTIIILILWTRRFRQRKFKLLAEDHKAELVFKSRQLGSRSHALILTTPTLAPSMLYALKTLKPLSLNRVQLFATLWAVAYQASLSMGFPRQEYWNGLPLPSPWSLPRDRDRKSVV